MSNNRSRSTRGAQRSGDPRRRTQGSRPQRANDSRRPARDEYEDDAPEYGYPEEQGSRVPAHVRQPGDRKAKGRSGKAQRRAQITEALNEGIEVEIDGLEIVIEPGLMDDLDFVERLGAAQTNYLLSFPVYRQMLGEEQYQMVREHYRNPDTDKISRTDVEEFFNELFEVIGGPNS